MVVVYDDVVWLVYVDVGVWSVDGDVVVDEYVFCLYWVEVVSVVFGVWVVGLFCVYVVKDDVGVFVDFDGVVFCVFYCEVFDGEVVGVY